MQISRKHRMEMYENVFRSVTIGKAGARYPRLFQSSQILTHIQTGYLSKITTNYTWQRPKRKI